MSVSAASFSTATDATAGSFVITKPTGLEVDDLMVAFISSENATAYSSTGWTVVTSVKPASVNQSLTCLSKTATAGDVAASNFTFTTDANDDSVGIIYRLSSSTDTPMFVTSFDEIGISASTSAVWPLVVVPAATSGILLAGIKTQNATVSAYALSPTNPSWTENIDTASGGTLLASISATPTVTTTTTQLAATLSASQDSAAILIFVGEQFDASGTNALLTATPVFFAETAQVDTNATAGLLTTAPAFFPVTGRTADAAVEWTDDEKGSATWTDQIK